MRPWKSSKALGELNDEKIDIIDWSEDPAEFVAQALNSILYYGQKVLIDAGFSAGGALIANIAPAVISVITAIIALRIIDRISRRNASVLVSPRRPIATSKSLAS